MAEVRRREATEGSRGSTPSAEGAAEAREESSGESKADWGSWATGSLMQITSEKPAARRAGRSATRPARSAVGTPMSAAMRMACSGALFISVWRSALPSPTISSEAPLSFPARPVVSATSVAPGASTAPAIPAIPPAKPPAAPNPASGFSSVKSAFFSVSSTNTLILQSECLKYLFKLLSPASRSFTCSGEAPFCGPNTCAAPRGPVRGASTSTAIVRLIPERRRSSSEVSTPHISASMAPPDGESMMRPPAA